MKEKVLITGATGFVGSNLLRRLVSTSAEIHILSRVTSNTWRIADIIDKINNHNIDLLESERLKDMLTLVKPDYVFHLANTNIYGGVSAPDDELIKTNLMGLINLISALSNIDYKGFINVGSSSEYGLKKGPMKETDSCEPMNVYGITKLAATSYASFVARIRNKPIITFRLFSPFGPYDDHRRLITKTILDISNNKKLALANPDAVRDYIFINDVVDLFIEAKDKAGDFYGEIFNLGTGQEHRVSEVVDLIIKMINPGHKVEWGIATGQPWESKKWESDMSKTLSVFKWRPKYSLTEGIKKTVDWFRANKNLYDQFFVEADK